MTPRPELPPPTHTTGPAYRFAVSASLQKALRWGACPWGSSLSASAHSRSLLWKGTRGGRALTLIFFQKKGETCNSRTRICLYLGSLDFTLVQTYCACMHSYRSHVMLMDRFTIIHLHGLRLFRGLKILKTIHIL